MAVFITATCFLTDTAWQIPQCKTYTNPGWICSASAHAVFASSQYLLAT